MFKLLYDNSFFGNLEFFFLNLFNFLRLDYLDVYVDLIFYKDSLAFYDYLNLDLSIFFFDSNFLSNAILASKVNTLYFSLVSTSNLYSSFYESYINFNLFQSDLIFNSLYSFTFFSLKTFSFFFFFFSLSYLVGLDVRASKLDLSSTKLIIYSTFISLWSKLGFEKLESYDESISIVLFWPWCIFLVLTHLFVYSFRGEGFIFIEWGLPVLYGCFTLIESFWLMGSHFLVYLTGSRGRFSFLITLLEDLISFFILLSRISLQLVRGIVCGLYHGFFRELYDFLVDSWEKYFFYTDYGIRFLDFEKILNIIYFIVDSYVLAYSLLFVYGVLFLQLLFLLIAIWLFCRCWFVSREYRLLNFNPSSFNI